MSGAAATSLRRSLFVVLARRWNEIAAAGYGLAVVGIVAASSGGYPATVWGWTAVVTLWLAVLALLLHDEIRIGRLELAYVGSALAFTIWVALSNLWTISVTSTMHEVQRDIAYTGVVAAAVVLVRQRAVRFLLGGVLAGIVLDSLYGLATRLLPARFGGFDSITFDYRLSAPITYWNGLGIFAAMGVLLALAFATRGRHLATRAAAAAALPLLAATAYFTFSRGAWYALALGLIVAIAVDPRRLQLIAVGLALAPPPVLAIVEVRKEPGLVTVGASLDQAAHDGHQLIPRLLVLAGASALAALVAGAVGRHLRVPRMVRIVFAAALILAVVAGGAAVWHREGSPEALARRGWDAFQGQTDMATNGNVAARLTSLSADGRIPLWHVSLRDFEHSPLIGQGAGTFWESWARYRTTASDSTQAHSLYLGTMGELGIVGLVVLVSAILVPVVGGIRSRHRRLVPLTLGAYVAWAAHAGIDWDWALLGVTIPALLCGVVLLKSRPQPGARLGWRGRALGVGAAAVMLVAAVPVLVADIRIRSAQQELLSDPAAAIATARSATQLAPWSSDPYLVMAQSYELLHRPTLAIRSVEKAISLDGSDWLLWQALQSYSTGSTSRAAAAKVHELNPLQPDGPG